jgi:hypothetical protein
LHAGIYLLEGEIKKYTHIRIRDYMGLRGHGCGEGIFYLGQTRRPGAHQAERSKETYHVYVYTRPSRCHTRTQQNDVYTHKDLRHVGQGGFISKDSTEEEAGVHVS